MAFEFLRDWARARVPIPRPKVARIPIEEVANDFGPSHLAGQLAIPLISPPEIKSGYNLELKTQTSIDLVYLGSEVFPIDMSLAHQRPRILPVDVPAFRLPDIHQPQGLDLFIYPTIVSLFDGPLTTPACAGKAYRSKAQAEAKPIQQTIDILITDNTTCRHGMPRNTCEYCYEETQGQRQATTSRQTSRRIPTVNVFDLLLPYLQPPIEALLAEPLLFSPGRRPHDYQIQGIRFLAEHESALLGDEMGLGKTIQTIVALQLLFRRGIVRNALVLCKRSLLGTWEKELYKWAPELYVNKVRGHPELRRQLWEVPASIYLTTYDTLRQDVDQIGAVLRKFQVIVLDEVQEIKNSSTQKARAAHQVPARYRWGLSGTPL